MSGVYPRTVTEANRERNFAFVKHRVSCLDVAERETPLRLSGNVYRGPCPVHGGDNASSFCLMANAQERYDAFYCHSCGASGDVVDLWTALEGPFRSASDAMENLAYTFGVELFRDEDLYSEVQLAARRAKKRAYRAFNDALFREIFEREIVPIIVEETEEGPQRRARIDLCLREAGLLRGPGR